MKLTRVIFTFVVVAIAPVLGYAQKLPDFTELIEKVSPAVVKITTQAKVGARSGPMPPGEEVPEIFRRFFDPRELPERNVGGMGSGFIVSEDGYVITNNHVVASADEIIVRMGDRREFEAEIVGSDEHSDLALLKIEASGLPYLEFASSEQLKVGEWVLAIGSPFGLDFSASQGIVSALGRDIPSGGGGSYVPFIQTDVAINPGNSGGPLFNLDGKVVGINSQIYTRSGGYMGLSFAIPSDVAQSVVKQLISKGRVERGYLGVQIRDLSREEAEAFGLSRSHGALVLDVIKDGPADRGGIKPGDVIIGFDKKEIGTAGDLPLVVGDTEPGRKVRVEVMREKKKRNITVEVGQLDNEDAPQELAKESPQGNTDRLGLVVEGLSDTQRQSLSLTGGVVVTQVEPGTPAAKANLRRGDVLVQLGFQDIANPEQYRRIVESLPTGSPVPIRIYRQGQPAYSTIRID